MGWSSPKLKAPISVGDLSSALNVASRDVGTIISTSSTIKKMAKYKGIISSNPGILSDTERYNARYGLNAPAIFNAASGDPLEWSYNRPLNGQPYEWFRMLDFDGYVNNACQPLAIGIGNFVYDDESQINVFIDEKSNAIRTDGATWITNESLSVVELMQNYADFNIAFLIEHSTVRNLVVTGITFRALATTYYGYYTFKLYGANATPPSGTPYIPIMSSMYSSSMFTIYLCAVNGAGPSGGALYNVISSNLSLYDPYSVRFEGDCDRIIVPLRSGVFQMDGISISNLALQAIDMVTEAQYNGSTWRAYRISASAYFDTSSVSWGPSTLAKTISGNIHLTQSGATAGFGSSPAQLSNLNDGISVAVYPSTTQTRYIFTTESNEFLWVLKGYTGGCTAYAEFTYPLTNPIRVPSGTGTVSVSVTAPA